MAGSLVVLYNQACGSVGEKTDISSPTEDSKAAETCELYYTDVLRHILAAAPWPSATAYVRPALVAENKEGELWDVTKPPRLYKYAYALPADCVRPRNLDTYEMFILGVLNNQRVLYTNEFDPVLEYTKKQTEISLWDPQLYQAVVAGLGAFIAMPLTGALNKASKQEQAANNIIIEAQLTAANEQFQPFESVPGWIQARGYSGPVHQTQFMYPHGPLLSVSNFQAAVKTT